MRKVGEERKGMGQQNGMGNTKRMERTRSLTLNVTAFFAFLDIGVFWGWWVLVWGRDDADGASSRAAGVGIAGGGAVDTCVGEILVVVRRGGRGCESGDWAFWMNELIWLREVCQLRVRLLRMCPGGWSGDDGVISSASMWNHGFRRVARVERDKSPTNGDYDGRKGDRSEGCEVLNVVRHSDF